MKLSLSQKRTIKIMILFIVTILITVLSVSFVLYSSFKNIIFSSFDDENKQLVHQINTLMNHMKEIIRVSGDQTLSNPYISAIRLKKEPTIEEELNGLSEMRNLATSGVYTRSVYVYNQNKGHIYSSELDKSVALKDFKDKEIVSILENYSTQPRFVPIPRIIKTPYGKDRVYSYILYEKRRDKPNSNNALVINIFDYWIDSVLESYGDNIIAIDKNGRIVASTNPSLFLTDISSQKFIKKILLSDKDYGHFTSNIEDEKKIVMFTYSKDMQWYFINTTSYNEMLKQLLPIKQSTMYILLALIILGFIIVSIIFIKIFMPFYKIVGVMDSNQDFNTCDTIYDFANSFESIISKSQVDYQVKCSYEELVKHELIKKYILGNYENIEQLDEQFKKFNIDLDLTSHLYLILILNLNSNDYYNFLKQNYSSSSFEFAQINGNTIIIIQNIDGYNICNICNDIKSNIDGCIIYNDCISNSSQISRAYHQLLEIASYRIFYSSEKVLGPHILTSRCEPFSYPVDTEILVIKKLKNGNLKQAKELTIDMLKDVSCYKYYDIIFSIKRMYLSIQTYYNNMSRFESCLQGNMSSESLEKYINSVDSFDDIIDLFNQLFQKINNQLDNIKINKNHILSQKVMKIIQCSYSNPELCLRMIADEFGMSHIYLGRLFKLEENISVSEYINKIRVEKAKQLLLNTKLSVGEIAHKVGFTNRNYFYPVFKINVGVTPKEFRFSNK